MERWFVLSTMKFQSLLCYCCPSFGPLSSWSSTHFFQQFVVGTVKYMRISQPYPTLSDFVISGRCIMYTNSRNCQMLRGVTHYCSRQDMTSNQRMGVSGGECIWTEHSKMGSTWTFWDGDHVADGENSIAVKVRTVIVNWLKCKCMRKR
jgi:hypothetical protein